MPPTNSELLWAAADLSTLATSVSGVIIALVGVALLFLGYRYLRKAGVK